MNIKEKVRFGILALAIFAVFAASIGVAGAYISLEDVYLDGLEPRYCNVDWRNVGDENSVADLVIEIDNITIYACCIHEEVREIRGFIVNPRGGVDFEINETEGTHTITVIIAAMEIVEARTLTYEGYGAKPEEVVEEEAVEDWLLCP